MAHLLRANRRRPGIEAERNVRAGSRCLTLALRGLHLREPSLIGARAERAPLPGRDGLDGLVSLSRFARRRGMTRGNSSDVNSPERRSCAVTTNSTVVAQWLSSTTTVS